MTDNEDRLLQRLSGLLAMAESSTNEAEAEAFMAKAQMLSTRHSIDLATARARATFRDTTARPVTSDIPIGPRGKQGLATYILLASDIADANGVRVLIGIGNTSVTLFGFAEDINLTRQLFGILLPHMVRASKAYLDTGAYKTDDVSKQVARTSFQEAYAQRVGRRLRDGQKQATSEAVANDPGTELVLVEKTRQVDEYYELLTDGCGHWRGVRSSDYSESASHAGAQAADSARLSSPTSLGSRRRAIEQ